LLPENKGKWNLSKAKDFTKRLVVLLQNVASAIAKLVVGKSFLLAVWAKDPLALFLIQHP